MLDDEMVMVVYGSVNQLIPVILVLNLEFVGLFLSI